MDPISQGALGAAATLSLWGNDKRLSPAQVAWIGALGAMAPDLDILIRSAEDSLLAVEFHRHFTHSLAFVPVGATLALLPWLFLRRVRSHLRLAWLISALGYFTHAPLDCATTYGTMYFWPLSDYRVSLSYVSVVDPLYTLPLLALVLFAALRARPALARYGFYWSVGYLALGAVQKARVSEVQTELVASRGHTAVRREVFTTFMNQITWRSLYEANGKIHVDQIRVPYLGTICTKEGSTVIPLPPPSPTLGPGAQRGHRLLRWFSSGWVATTPSDPTLLADVRYAFEAYGTHPFWGIRIDEATDKAHWVQTRAERKMNAGALSDLIFKNPTGSICRE